MKNEEKSTQQEQVKNTTEVKTFPSLLAKLMQGWNLIMATITLIMVGIAYFVFDYSPFEDAISKKEKLKIVSFYKELGNKFINLGKYDDAKTAFQKAVNLDNYDNEAILNLEKLKIFDTSDSAKYYSDVVVDTKLNLFLEKFPNDAFVYCQSAERYTTKGDAPSIKKAKELLDKAIKLNPNFLPAYLGYATAYEQTNQIDSSIFYLKKAVAIDSTMTLAQGNLGYYYMLKKEYPNAILCMQKANDIELSWVFDHDLGVAYLCNQEAQKARETHQRAFEVLSAEKAEKEVYTQGAGFSQYFPTSDTDSLSQNKVLGVNTLNDKLCTINFQLGIDYLFEAKDDKAQKHFQNALKLIEKSEQKQELIDFFKNVLAFRLYHHKNKMPKTAELGLAVIASQLAKTTKK